MMMSYRSLKRSLVRVASRVDVLGRVKGPRSQGLKCLSAVLAVLCLCSWLSSSATAQLRSGRTTRTLYADEPQVRPVAARPGASRDQRQQAGREPGLRASGQRRSAAVVSASYSESPIIEEDSSYEEFSDSQFAPMDGGMTYFDSDSYPNSGAGSFGAGGCGEATRVAPIHQWRRPAHRWLVRRAPVR